MGKDPDAIRREIEATRAEMAGTVDALAYKGDVKNRTKDKVRSLTSKPKGVFVGIKDNVMGTVQQHTPDRSTVNDVKDNVSGAASTVSGVVTAAPGHVADGARRVGGIARENPLGLALGGLALGFVAGTLIPNTRMEDERLGPVGDKLRESVKDTGSELVDHGREVAQAAIGAAQDAVQETTREEGSTAAHELADSAKEKVSDVRSTVGSGSFN